ncbi:hypothetical protein P5U49_000240 [Neisseria gonorrhoeae]
MFKKTITAITIATMLAPYSMAASYTNINKHNLATEAPEPGAMNFNPNETAYRDSSGRLFDVLGPNAADFENIAGDIRLVRGNEGTLSTNLPASFFGENAIDTVSAKPVIQIVMTPLADVATITAVTFGRDFTTGKVKATAKLLNPDKEGEYWKNAPVNNFNKTNPFSQFNHSHKRCGTHVTCDLGANEKDYWYGISSHSLPVIASMLANKYSTDQVMVTVVDQNLKVRTERSGGKFRKKIRTYTDTWMQPSYYVLDMVGTATGTQSGLYRVENCGEGNECWAKSSYGLLNVNAGDWVRQINRHSVQIGQDKVYARWAFSLLLAVVVGPGAGLIDLMLSRLNGTYDEYYTPGRLLGTGLLSNALPGGHALEGGDHHVVDRFNMNRNPKAGLQGDKWSAAAGVSDGRNAMRDMNTLEKASVKEESLKNYKEHGDFYRTKVYGRINAAEYRQAMFKGNREAEAGRSAYQPMTKEQTTAGKHDMYVFKQTQDHLLGPSIETVNDGTSLKVKNLGQAGDNGLRNASSVLVDINERGTVQNNIRKKWGDLRMISGFAGYQIKEIEEGIGQKAPSVCDPHSFIPC